MLASFSETEKSIVHDVLQRIRSADDNMGIEADDLWMALMHCHLVLNNILISPQSQHLRMIRVDDDIFKRRVGRFPIFQKMLKSLGFKLEKKVKGRVFVLENPNFGTVSCHSPCHWLCFAGFNGFPRHLRHLVEDLAHILWIGNRLTE